MKIKTFIFIIPAIFLLTLSSKAQNVVPSLPIDADSKLITYKEVVTVTGNQVELYNRAIEFVNKQYKNPTEATKVRNPASGLIEIIHRIELSKTDKGVTLPAGIVEYSMKIELKEGRYRYIITNFTLREASRQPIERWMDKKDKSYSPAFDNYLKQVDDYTKKLIENLKTALQPPAPKKVDEW